MGMLELVDRSRLGRGEVDSCKFKSYYPYLEESLIMLNIYLSIYCIIVYINILPILIIDVYTRYMVY